MKAVGKNILVQMDVPDEKEGEIIIPEGPTKTSMKNKGTVVSVGNQVDLPLKPGDRILVRAVLSIPGTRLDKVIEDHVICVLEEGDE